MKPIVRCRTFNLSQNALSLNFKHPKSFQTLFSPKFLHPKLVKSDFWQGISPILQVFKDLSLYFKGLTKVCEFHRLNCLEIYFRV